MTSHIWSGNDDIDLLNPAHSQQSSEVRSCRVQLTGPSERVHARLDRVRNLEGICIGEAVGTCGAAITALPIAPSQVTASCFSATVVST